MSEEFESISVPKELLENLVRRILAEYISLSTPEPEQDEEPACVVHNTDTPEHFAIITPAVPVGTKLYIHPSPRPEFVRLSEEELRSCFTETNEAEPLAEGWPGLERFARAIEDTLEEKNK